MLVWLPSLTLSSTPVTVTVCRVSQSLELKLRLSETLASPASLRLRFTDTLFNGSELSFTVKVAEVPVSLTVTLSAETTKIAVSSSVSVILC